MPSGVTTMQVAVWKCHWSRSPTKPSGASAWYDMYMKPARRESSSMPS